MQESMLSTIDNPFSPFDEFDEWDQWDREQGYYTTAFLARIVKTSDDLSEADQKLAYEEAVDEIVNENVLGLYVKLSRTIN